MLNLFEKENSASVKSLKFAFVIEELKFHELLQVQQNLMVENLSLLLFENFPVWAERVKVIFPQLRKNTTSRD